MSGFFIIGDVHGCFNTFQEMLTHWDPENETLIQVGDLIDRGSKSAETVDLAMKLSQEFSGKVFFLRGNHEQMMVNYYKGIDTNWLYNGGVETMRQIKESNLDIHEMLTWISKCPLHHLSHHLAVSHAGISHHPETMEPNHPNGLLWNRAPLKDLGKPQVVGHTPQPSGRPFYDSNSQTWYIDTAAYRGVCLTGLKFDQQGNHRETISIPTYSQDMAPW